MKERCEEKEGEEEERGEEKEGEEEERGGEGGGYEGEGYEGEVCGEGRRRRRRRRRMSTGAALTSPRQAVPHSPRWQPTPSPCKKEKGPIHTNPIADIPWLYLDQ